MVAVDDWIKTLMEFVGVPVRHRGLSRGGVDCSGLIIASLAEHGVSLERPFSNGKLPRGIQVTDAVAGVADETDEVVKGAVLQVLLGKEPRHLMVCLGENQCGQTLVIHADGRKSRVVVTILQQPVFKIWKFKGVEF